jgi:C-terminal processing protease CtpA/Prc
MSKKWMIRRAGVTLFLSCAAMAPITLGQQPALSSMERGQVETMLSQVREEVAHHYYDPKFRGVDLDARFSQYKERIGSAQNIQEALRDVAAFLAGFHDSHTFFEPPGLTNHEDYGYLVQMIGDRCFVTQLRPGSDAAAKLHPGDEILSLNGYKVTRADLWQLRFALNNLTPVLQTKFLVRAPDGQTREVLAAAKTIPKKKMVDLTFEMGDADFWNEVLNEERSVHDLRERYVEQGDLLIWKMPAFFMAEPEMDRVIAIARHHKALILDLRGNPGGSVDVLEHLVGCFFDHPVQIAQPVGRKQMKPLGSKRRGDIFTGALTVLVDSESASAAELFARTMQLNHRGTVMGDLSSGSVMEARFYPMQQGSDIVMVYGASITEADLLMPDGQSLENHGVIPDEAVLPTAGELAAGLDPVLAHAAEKAGFKLDPKTAGSLFPFEWIPFGSQ